MSNTVTGSRTTDAKQAAVGPTNRDGQTSVTQPSHRSGLFVWVLVILAFSGGWFASTWRGDHKHRESMSDHAAQDPRATSAVSVTVEPVRLRPVQRIVEALGTLHGFESVTISARVEGRVRRIFHDIADQVKPGELLMEIDPTDYELSVQQSDRALQVELAKLGLKEPPEAKLDLEKIPVRSEEHTSELQSRL